MFEKPKRNKKLDLADFGVILEKVMAVIVLVGIVVAVFALVKPFQIFVENRENYGEFLGFLGRVFSIVIGIEFFKLLSNPRKDTLLEVLMFVIARHMIIEKTSAMENLLSVITIGILFFIDRFLLGEKHFDAEKTEKTEEPEELEEDM